MTRTLNHAHAAAETDRFINDRTVIRYFDGTCRTCLLTDTAADTADRTDLSGFFAILLVRIPGVYLTSIWFPDTLFPMGIATACGSLTSIIICLLVFRYLKKKPIRTAV